MNSLPLVLASTSAYRKALLERLRLKFETANPNIDETVVQTELPEDIAKRLAVEKARALAPHYNRHLIIGSDQVASLGHQIFGKPGNFNNAQRQLLQQSGKTVIFNTAIAILNSKTNRIHLDNVVTEVTFKTLSTSTINRYLEQESPYDCAGSFKSEGLGIALFEKITSDDPTALIGLPLIKTLELLEKHGYAVI